MKRNKLIPIFDCPYCNGKDLPASHKGPYIKRMRDERGRFVKGGYMEIHIWRCPNCNNVLNLVSDFKPKKWITVEELEVMGWKEIEDETTR